ncbi:MAG: FlgD immunoglobulin-like domain containing protein [Bacteroidota bacterium]|nr:FlgD immunoglobulin-like domain containing protein [Bacteroidota bacterium]
MKKYIIILVICFNANLFSQSGWFWQNPLPQGNHLESIYFTDSNTGCGVGYAGTIFKTTDGGTNWTSQSSGTTNNLRSVYFTDSNTGWAVGADGTILKTTTGGEVTSVKDMNSTELPNKFILSQNYPNPFNPITTISYTLPTSGNVKINIYNLNGKLVRKLLNENKSAGTHSSNWDGRDNHSNMVSSGTYFYQIQIGDIVNAKRMILVK